MAEKFTLQSEIKHYTADPVGFLAEYFPSRKVLVIRGVNGKSLPTTVTVTEQRIKKAFDEFGKQGAKIDPASTRIFQVQPPGTFSNQGDFVSEVTGVTGKWVGLTCDFVAPLSEEAAKLYNSIS